MTTRARCSLGIALGALITVPVGAAAQTPPAAANASVSRDTPVVWVVTTDGQERKGRLVSFSPEELVLHANKANQIIKTAQIARVDTTDSISNGVRNGAITGAALGGLGLVALYSSCSDCSAAETAVGGVLVVGIYVALGAGFGALIDHWIAGREPIYTRTAPSPISLQPIVGPRQQGIQLRVRW